MLKKLANIKVLIWDVDGTFYKFDEAHKQTIRESEFIVIMNHTGWSHEKTAQEFYKIYPKTNPSGTNTASILSGISVRATAKEAEKYNYVEKFVKYDEKVVNLFSKLQNFSHYILMNGTKNRAMKIIKLVGLKSSIFKEIVTSEKVGENKPSLKGFQYILDKTGLKPEEHLMIGDRELVDLVPAKKLGIKTCLVWSEKKSEIADVTIANVYTLSNLLLEKNDV